MGMQKKQNGELNLLRFVFSIIILIFHWNLTFKYGVVTNGNIGVEFFFILNGFFMCRSAENRKLAPTDRIGSSTWTYLMGKIRKFFPYYLCVVLLQLIVRFIIIKHEDAAYVGQELFKSIPTFTLSFMVLNYKTASLYVGNTWYLSSMLVVMLMLYPLLLKSYDSHAKITIPLICLFLLGYLYQTNESIMVWESWAGLCYFATLRALADISFGACVYGICSAMTKKFAAASENIVVRIFFTLVKILCYFIVFRFAMGKGKAVDNLYILLWAGLGVALSYSELGFTIPDSALSRYLAKLALPIFIFHGFMRYAVRDVIGSGPVSAKVFWGLVVCSVIASVLLMYMTDFIQRGLKRMTADLAAPKKS